MVSTAYETRLADEPVTRRAPSPAEPDTVGDMTCVIRRVLRNPGSQTPLSRAIRAALAHVRVPALATAGEGEAIRIQQVARRMCTLMADNNTAANAHFSHRETVRV